MPRSNLTITGLDFGKADKNLAYYYGLSDFWYSIFQDSDKIELLLEANSQKLSDVYSDFLQLAATISINDIGTATNQQLKLILITEDDAVQGQLNTYTLSTPILESRLIVNRPFLPTAYYEDEIHYRLADDGSTIQFFTGLSLMGFPSRTLTSGAKQYALWFVDTLIDEQALYDYFGKLIGIDPQASTEAYKNFIYGLYYLYTNGPNLALMRKGLNLALGIPLARETETVLEIRKYLETDQYLVITDLNSYLIPFGLLPTVAVGDVLNATDELAQWIEVKDYVHDGDWWINLALPPQIMPYIPPGEIDRYAKAGSYADTLMRNFLKKHTFLVNVKTIDFKNLQTFEQLSSIINEVKPSYTYPIYIWTVPLDDENFNMDDSLFTLRWDQFKCDNITVPISKFQRLNAIYPNIANKPISIQQNDDIRLTHYQLSYRNSRADQSITLETYWEVIIENISVSGEIAIGVGNANYSVYDALGSTANSWVYLNNGQKRNNNVTAGFGASYVIGDVIGVNYAPATGTLKFYKNGSLQGTAYTGIVGTIYPVIGLLGNNGAYFFTPGTASGNFASTVDTQALSIPGSMDLRTNVAVTDLVTPTFDVPFADLGSGQVNTTPLIGAATPSFTRATTATTINSTGTVIAVSSNTPRSNYDPTTLQYVGYLSELARTNTCLQSSDYSNATWIKAGTTIGGSITLPDGTTGIVNKIQEDNGAGLHAVSQVGLIAINTTYVASVWAKAAEETVMVMANDNTGTATFNLGTGVASQDTGVASMIPYSNGWYRCIWAFTASGTATNTLRFNLRLNSGFQGVTGNGLYLWGAQFEQATFVTSYIPTTTIAVTRNADVLNYDPSISSWYNQSAGTFYAQWTAGAAVQGYLFGVRNLSGVDLEYVRQASGAQPGFYVQVAGVAQADLAVGSAVVPGTTYKVIGAATANDFFVAIPTATQADGSGTMPAPDRADVGHVGGGQQPCGSILRATYFSSRLTNAQVQRFTNTEQRGLIAKWRTTGNQRSYALSLDTPTALTLSVSSDGTTVARFVSDGFTLAPDVATYFRVTLNAYANNTIATFYTSTNAGLTWTQLGATKTLAGTVSIFNSTAPVEIGSTADGASSIYAGRTHYAEISNGLNPGDTYVLLSGTSNNKITTPDSVVTNISGDIDIRIKAALNSWTPAVIPGLVDKYNGGGINLGYTILVWNDGRLDLRWGNAGVTTEAFSTVATGLANGAVKWVRATLDVDNGAGGNTTTFYLSDDGVVWTQLGSPIVNSGITSISANTLPLSVGVRDGASLLAGRVYYAEVRNGINGTVVASFNPSLAPLEATSVPSPTGETWTIGQTGNSPARLVTERVVSRFEPAQLDHGGRLSIGSDTGETYSITRTPVYLSVPGSVSNYASTVDSLRSSVTGDIDIRLNIALTNWNPGSVQTLISKHTTSGNQKSYVFNIDAVGKMQFGISTNGSSVTTVISDAATGFIANSLNWIRVTRTITDGNVIFYTSTDGITWTPFGTVKNISAGVAIFDSTAPTQLSGIDQTGGTQWFTGKLYYAEVLGNGVTAIRFNPNADSNIGNTSLVSSASGEIWILTQTGSPSPVATLATDAQQARFHVLYQNPSTNTRTAARFNFGNYPFLFTPPTTATPGLYMIGQSLTRGCPQFTRAAVSHYTNQQLANDSQINAKPLSFEAGVVSGYVDSIKQLRRNSTRELGWLRAVVDRNAESYRKPRGVMMFQRGSDVTDGTGVGIRGFQQSDVQKRIVYLYTTTQADIASKFTGIGGQVPGLDQWSFTLFQPFRTSTAIDVTPIDQDYISNNFFGVLQATYSTFFFPNATYQYLGNFMPPMAYRTFAPALSDIQPDDYLLFIRVYENTVAVYWVTSNLSLEVQAVQKVENTDQFDIYSDNATIKHGLCFYSSYYLLRGAGSSLTYSTGGPIDGSPIDAGLGTTSTAISRTYADDENPVPITIDHSGIVLKFRRDFK